MRRKKEGGKAGFENARPLSSLSKRRLDDAISRLSHWKTSLTDRPYERPPAWGGGGRGRPQSPRQERASALSP